MRALVTDKLAKPPRRDPGPEPRQEWLPVDNLVIDPEYQREVTNEGRRAIERIASRFEWSKFSPIVVSPVSLGRHAIIDGQHRATAAKLCGHASVPCYIIALDRAGQAASFAAINGSVTKITPWHVFKAALAAGEGWAVQANAVAAEAGCKLMTSNKSASDKLGGEIYGVNTMRDMIARYGADVVTAALKAYKLSIYGDLPVAWINTVLFAWVSAVAITPGAAKMQPAQLARFHDRCDILEADDAVVEEARQIRKAGGKPPAHMGALASMISVELELYVQERSAKAGAA